MSIRVDRTTSTRARELTGRTVLVCFLVFFGVVGAVNAVMIRAAISTFSGLETESSYQAGLAFENEVTAAHAQEALHWQVNGRVSRKADGMVTVALDVKDRAGAVPAHLAASARLAHPTDARFDRQISLDQVAPGRFTGVTDAQAGQWDLIVDLGNSEERLFRSRSRVLLH
ncbi:MAG: FixH family protein [Xanthobacteraceae bacterium]